MKKLFVITLCLLLSKNVFATEANSVFGGYSSGAGYNYGYLGGARALSGDIDKDGALLRVGAGFGTYKYKVQSLPRNGAEGKVGTGDLMAGYQKFFEKGRVTFYGGVSYGDYHLNENDNFNKAAGSAVGAKGQLELFLEPVKNLLVENISSYDSVYNTYWSQTFVGWHFAKFAVGPEVAFLGNRAFDQQRAGLKFSDINLSHFAKMYVSAGYMKSTGSMGSDGVYGSVGLSRKF